MPEEVAERLKGLFDKIPQAMMLDERLAPLDREVYGAMLSFCPGHKPEEKPVISVTVDQLLGRLACSRRRVFYSLANLKATGWIERLSHGDKKAGRYPNTYRIFAVPNKNAIRRSKLRRQTAPAARCA